jgi:hypothetical protein
MAGEASDPLHASPGCDLYLHPANNDDKSTGESEAYVPPSLGNDFGESIQTDAPPSKNTFIHFDIPKSPQHERAIPTSSAPGKMLSRLFRLKAADVTALVASTVDSAVDCISHSIQHDVVWETSFGSQDSDVSTSAPPSVASPSVEQEGDHRATSELLNCTIDQTATDLHNTGNCTPCNYFHYKIDGCRMGDACPFCHLCAKGEVKKRKRDKLKELRAAGLLRGK